MSGILDISKFDDRVSDIIRSYEMTPQQFDKKYEDYEEASVRCKNRGFCKFNFSKQ